MSQCLTCRNDMTFRGILAGANPGTPPQTETESTDSSNRPSPNEDVKPNAKINKSPLLLFSLAAGLFLINPITNHIDSNHSTAHPHSRVERSIALVHPDNQMLGFLAYNPVDALCAIELPHNEFLLVFNTLGVFVDVQGRKSRDTEIMYPAIPTFVAFSDGNLLIYSETHIDVFDSDTGEWLQTLNLKKSRPLCRNGELGFAFVADLPHIIYLSDLSKVDRVRIPDPEIVRQRTRRKFSVRENAKAAKAKLMLLLENQQLIRNTDRRSKLISAPSNFNHISHMGPGDGIQIQRLMDLPSALEATSDAQGMQRVRSMLHNSANRGSPSQRQFPEPPRRSLSHQGNIPNQPPHYNGVSPPGLPPRRPMVPPPMRPQARSPRDNNSEEGTLDGSPRHSLTSNNSSNLSSPPSPSGRPGSSSYESQMDQNDERL